MAFLRFACLTVAGLALLTGGSFLSSKSIAVQASSLAWEHAEAETAMLGPGGDAPLTASDFFRSAPQGFGDRQNSAMWSMQWWPKTGKLYVGTNRAWLCWSIASVVNRFPALGFFYPPMDPDVECTPDYNDLPLRAEIWAWTPDPVEPEGAGTWELVYQSPEDVPIPGTSKFVARDIGYRTMAIFTEPDGTEALYIGGTNAKSIHNDVPPPRILRTTDGVTFEAIPQEPGTLMGDLDKASFRSMMSYKGRLYVIHGSIQGNGVILESADPALGNNAWRQASPPEDQLRAYVLQEFNSYLYVGTFDALLGYSILKTDATGIPPYVFTPVVERGGYLAEDASMMALSAQVFNGKLYFGTDDPAEIIRINPDDSWDLIVGTPRMTPDGMKYPLSGLDEGFNYAMNDHIWRMQSHDGALYILTFDYSTWNRLCPENMQVLVPFMGFDLYRSTDGVHFSAITLNGFGDGFDYGGRTFQSTPFGLFFGTANIYYGANVYRGIAAPSVPCDLLDPPGVVLGSPSSSGNRLAWEASPGATLYHVYRAPFTTITGTIPIPSLPGGGCGDISGLPPEIVEFIENLPEGEFEALAQQWGRKIEVPARHTKIGTTTLTFFIDTTAVPGVKYSYYVVAENECSVLSGKSNLVTFPLPGAPVPAAVGGEVFFLGGERDLSADVRQGRTSSTALFALIATGIIGLIVATTRWCRRGTNEHEQ